MLRSLRIWAGSPSYDTIRERVSAAWKGAGRPASELAKKTTVVDCFKIGRRRLNTDLVVAVVRALHPEVGYVAQWRQALRVVNGEIDAASQVRVQNTLPPNLAGFTGRTAELDRLRRALHDCQRAGGAVVTYVFEGMAGVGKTQLAVHAGHMFVRDGLLDRVLFVNLRGFHPDPNQPPADPAAVLEGFLRLLGVPGQQIPHQLPSRIAAYRERLAGTRTLVVLDNAASEDQVRPLLPEASGCLTMVTSRRSLLDLREATHVAVDVFSPEETEECLTQATAGTPVGSDPNALARIARRCDHLPLAVGLVTGHIRSTPGWTLTDHADRLDERHRDRRLDTGVEDALDLSYENAADGQRRLLRLAALHPSQDLDAYAAAALTNTDLPAAEARLRDLCRDHLLQQIGPGRYAMHDLVRAYAATRASDEDSPSERRTALTRLFDYYLATAAVSVNTLYPVGPRYRARMPPVATPMPALPDPDTALAWLDTERPTLVSVAAHTATNGWPSHTTRLSIFLFRYLISGHPTDALAIHGHARNAADRAGDLLGQAHALDSLGCTYIQLGRHAHAAERLQHALTLFERTDDSKGESRSLTNLAIVEIRLGRYRPAVDHLQGALALDRRSDDASAAAATLVNLGLVEARLGEYESAAEHLHQALTQSRANGNHSLEAATLTLLGDLDGRLGRCGPAIDHHEQALALQRSLGQRDGEAWTLATLGVVHTRCGRPMDAATGYQRALAIFKEIGERDGEAWVHNGLGEAAAAIGKPHNAIAHHRAAHGIAAEIGDRYQHARAHAGLGQAHDALGNRTEAHRNYTQALNLYTELGTPEAEQMRNRLTILAATNANRP